MTFNCEPVGLLDEINRLSVRVPRLKSIVKGELVYSPLRMPQLQSLGIHQAKACTITVKPVLLILRRVMPCVLALLLTQWPSNNLTEMTVVVAFAMTWAVAVALILALVRAVAVTVALAVDVALA